MDKILICYFSAIGTTKELAEKEYIKLTEENLVMYAQGFLYASLSKNIIHII